MSSVATAKREKQQVGSLEALSHKLDLSQAVHKATQGLSALKLKVSEVSSVARTEEGWRITVELIERLAIPDTMDLLGVYEVLLDQEGEMLGYERIRIRHRGDMEEKAD